MTFPFALCSDPWNIFTFVMDSMDFPSIGLTTLQGRKGKEISRHILLPNTNHALLKTSAAYHGKMQSAHGKAYAQKLTKHTYREVDNLQGAIFQSRRPINKLFTPPCSSPAFPFNKYPAAYPAWFPLYSCSVTTLTVLSLLTCLRKAVLKGKSLTCQPWVPISGANHRLERLLRTM